MKLRISVLTLMVGGLSILSAHATTLGITDYSAYSQHAFWDTFASKVITNAAPASGTGFTGVGLSQSSTSAIPFYGPYDNGDGPDYFYEFDQATSWALNFTSTSSVPTLVLQIKANEPSVGSLTDYFQPVLTINGGSAVLGGTSVVSAGTGESVFGDFDMYVVTFTWTGLDALSGSAFNISMDRAVGNHVAIDGFQIAAIPEPSTYALLGLGLGVLIVLRKRRVNS